MKPYLQQVQCDGYIVVFSYWNKGSLQKALDYVASG
jgi:hypothetical protein